MGAIIGSVFGFKAYVNIPEGESADEVFLRSSPGHNHKKLGFTVNCEKFIVDFYDNGTPREYRSDLSFIINGKTVKKSKLLVNHPVTFKGITFYQASYGSLAGDKARLKFLRGENDKEAVIKELELGKPITLPGEESQILISDIRDDFMRMGPAVSVVIKPPQGEEIIFWLFKNHELIQERFPDIFNQFPRLNPSAYKPYTLYLDDIETRHYTGLQINRDPGVFLVYTGFTMIIIGLFITFFTSHRRIWVRITTISKDDLRVSVAGRANKNPVGLERELDQLTSRLKNTLNPERNN